VSIADQSGNASENILATILERVDLHTHSAFSDGVLSPRELVARAAARGVGLLALTDHDTLAGCASAEAACLEHGIGFVPGIELSATWRGQAVHVIGLAADAQCAELTAHAARIVARRRDRIAEIGDRLERRAHVPGIEIALQVLARCAVPTRQHLARALVEGGFMPDVPTAFEKLLGRGCEGHVPAAWPSLEETLAVLRQGCREIVVAHAHRYRLSAGALRNLVSEFAALGGTALEVSLAGMSPSDSDRIGRLARSHALAGSAGSDFHDPSVPWNPLGRWLKLPDGIEPLAERLYTELARRTNGA
jgi:predicted metal-dependent phosphoesterase TrpH